MNPQTGLIILLSGAHTSDLPLEITNTIAQVHGMKPQQLEVRKATITLFLIICPGQRVRDAIIQIGVYTIEHLDV
jgi:hypothetical protein